MKRKIMILAAVLCMIINVSGVAFAADVNAITAADKLELDDGNTLTIPAAVLENDYFMVVRDRTFTGYRHLALVFDSPVYRTTASVDFTLYYSESALLLENSYDISEWSYYEHSLNSFAIEEEFTILYSTFDYCDGAGGSVIYPSSLPEAPVFVDVDWPGLPDDIPSDYPYIFALWGSGDVGDRGCRLVAWNKPLDEAITYRSSDGFLQVAAKSGMYYWDLTWSRVDGEKQFYWTSRKSTGSTGQAMQNTGWPGGIAYNSHAIYLDDYNIPVFDQISNSGGSVVPDEEIPSDSLIIDPVRSYDDILPSVQGVIDAGGVGATSDAKWLVYRDTQDVYLEFDSNGEPVGIEDTQWSYWLAFLPNGYDSLEWSKQERTAEDGSIHYVWPQLRINSSVIHRYRLSSDSFDDSYITDAVLDGSSGDSQWVYHGVVNNYLDITGYDSMLWTHGAYEEMLSNTFVASNFNYVVAADEVAFIYYEEGSAIPSYSDYTLAAFAFPAQSYVGFDSDGSGSDEGGSGTGSDVTKSWLGGWLQKIYKAIVDGFESVVDKLDGTNDSVLDEDITGNEDEDSGFSILSLLQSLFGGIKSILGGFANWLLGSFDGVINAIKDFFGVFEPTSETSGATGGLFGWIFDSAFFGNVSGFWAFVVGLWSDLPVPVHYVINFGFSVIIAIALLKIFTI